MQRRSFIKYASLAAAGNLMGLRAFGSLNALASTPSDYKALVCVFLNGGNDANNMLIPFDTKGYANYASIRGPLALAQNSLLPLTPLPNFALHTSMPEVQSLFNTGAAALVANVGNLTQPMTQAQFLAGQTAPSCLYSHADQQIEWQNAAASRATETGWAGRIADVMSGTYNPSGTIPMVTSVSGNARFGAGAATTNFVISPGNFGAASCSEGAACNARLAASQTLVQLSSGVSLVMDSANIESNAYSYTNSLQTALSSGTALKTTFPSTSIALQFQQIAEIMQVRASLGVGRQIFFCNFGSFDTHGLQLETQATLLAQLSAGLQSFYEATQELGLANSVTTFTMSDFARTLQPNSNTGSDHAWGSHHIVLGGAVKGGAMYGTFPTLALGGPDDADVNGRWIPTISSVQYASTLAQWFGVPQGQLATVFPNIANFSTTNVGFV